MWVCGSKTNYVNMFVGALARGKGVKIHLELNSRSRDNAQKRASVWRRQASKIAHIDKLKIEKIFIYMSSTRFLHLKAFNI